MQSCRSRRSRLSQIEQLESRLLMAADLTPNIPVDWTAPAFVTNVNLAKVPGVNMQDSETLYVGGAYKNVGDAAAINTKMIIKIDGKIVLTNIDTFTLNANGGVWHHYNVNIGKLYPGTHTLEMILDPDNAVVENDETNNTFSAQFTVGGLPAAKVAFSGGVKPAVAGATIAPVKVKVTNTKNKPIVGESVTLAIDNGPGGALGGTVTRTTDGTGVAVFDDLVLTVAGTYKLVATDGALTSPLSGTLKISPGALATLEFTQFLGSVFAGDTFNQPIAVKATDAFGNVIKGKVIKLAIATGPVGDKIYGSSSGVTDASGIAKFPKATFHIAGAHTLEASNLTQGVTVTGQSNSFTVRAGSMKTVLFIQLPVGAVHGQPTTIEGAVADAYGNEIDLDLLEMGISLVAKPGGAWLETSNYNQPISNGHATFPDLVFTKAGKYSVKLRVGLATSVSTVFTVL